MKDNKKEKQRDEKGEDRERDAKRERCSSKEIVSLAGSRYLAWAGRSCSTSLSSGNQVDGLPLVVHLPYLLKAIALQAGCATALASDYLWPARCKFCLLNILMF